MRLTVLTTDTQHHAHFIREVSARFPILRVLEETASVVPPFPTAHPFEEEREVYERRIWFDGEVAGVADFGEVSRHENLNSEGAVRELRALGSDVVVVFGCGKLSRPVIEVCGERIVNLHGGDPEAYRGLDTHLWAIYHGEFAELSTTLHLVNAELDGGGIVANLPIPIRPGMRIHELRRYNTEICVRLVVKALNDFRERGYFVSREQRTCGRYYSFMPAVLKDICVRKFHGYTETLR